MAYTEFCCRSGGSNLNAGTRTGNSTEPATAASFTYASGTWVASTGVLTVASGNPQSDGVAVGDFASVYPDGSSVTGFVGRVTAVSTTTITVSLTAKAGTAPTDGTSNRTLKIGGAWAGPASTTAFPFGFVQSTLTNSTVQPPRINLKNDQTYSVTAAMTHGNAGSITWEGYSSSYGDGGRATIDGGTSGVSYIVLTLSGAGNTARGIVWSNNGATGSADLVVSSGAVNQFDGCVFSNSRGCGLSFTTNTGLAVECEAFACNASNTGNKYGMGASVAASNGPTFLRCIGHDNAGANTAGIELFACGGVIDGCIADSNGGRGLVATSGPAAILNSVAYGNGSNGIDLPNTGTVGNSCRVENNISYLNGGFGLAWSGAYAGRAINNAYGSNTSGPTSIASTQPMVESGTVTLTADPFIDAANGDFRLNTTTGGGALLRGTGRGSFLQTAASYAGTVSYPDIGAAQHADPANSGGYSGGVYGS